MWRLRDIYTKYITERILSGAKKSMTEKEFYQLELLNWKDSEQRIEMLTGERYYCGEQDILNRKRTAIGEGGKLIDVDNLPNNKIIDNQYAKAVNQKENYILGKPLTFKSEDENYSELLRDTFDKNFHRKLKSVCKDSLNCGIGWLYIYYDESGNLQFKRYKPYEIYPFWDDDDHTILNSAMRYYNVIQYNGRKKEVVEKVEIYTKTGIERYVIHSGKLVDDIENPSTPYMIKDGQEYSWNQIPLIAFKYNSDEIPLIRYCKSLQDSINEMVSDYANNMQEDQRNTILVLKNYDGQDLGEFRRNLATYGAVKVRTIEGSDGGVDTLNIQVNSDNYKSILELLKKALLENAKAFDCKDDRLSGSPNEMNIKSIYSDMDVDARGMETEYQAAFEKLLFFADTHFSNNGQGDFFDTDVEIVFNKDMMVSESDTINNIRNSSDLLSNESLLAKHPWVNDIQQEMNRLASQKEERQNRFNMPNVETSDLGVDE